MPVICLILLTLLAGVLLALGWRVASNRQSLPCPVWLRWMVELDNPFTKTNRAAVIIGHLDVQPGMAVLDAGCGPGRLTIPLAQAAAPQGEVYALDIQPGMLGRVKEKADAAQLRNIRFLHAGLGEGKLPRGHFDRAVMVTVLGEIPGRPDALAEIHAALKPGAILAITEIIFDPHFLRRRTVTQLATAAGFREKAFHGNPIAYTLLLEKPVG